MPSTHCKICKEVTGSYLFKYCSAECQEMDRTDEDRERDRQTVEVVEKVEEFLRLLDNKGKEC
jgi:predicted nucleic acid-binding Zn ribbon protein